MKTKILSVIVLILIVSSCVNKSENDNIEKALDTGQERIKLVSIDSPMYLYEIDNHTYIVSSWGGIIHSEGCKCKNSR